MSRISFREVSWLLILDSSCSGGYSGLEMQKYSQKGRAGSVAPLARGSAFGGEIQCPPLVLAGANRSAASVELWCESPPEASSRAFFGQRPSAGFQPGAESLRHFRRALGPGLGPQQRACAEMRLLEGVWQREAFSAPAPLCGRSAGDEICVGVALS